MKVFTEEFKTAAAKFVAYSLVALPIILLLLLAGGIERGVATIKEEMKRKVKKYR